MCVSGCVSVCVCVSVSVSVSFLWAIVCPESNESNVSSVNPSVPRVQKSKNR